MDGEPKHQEELEDGEPVCLHCLHSIDPLMHYCPQCGEAVGQLTPYIPFVNVRWSARIWGEMWRQVWSSKVSILGRLFRFIMIVFFVPILLLGFIPMLWGKIFRERSA